MRSPVLVLAAAVLATLAVACGGSEDDTTVAAPTTTQAARSEPGRESAPAISGTSLDGDAIALADYRGHPVLINVWSSW